MYYKNGDLVDSTYYSHNATGGENSNLYIGSRPNPENLYRGTLDNLQIWNVVLTNEKIQSFITCPPSGNEDGLVGYWNFNEGSGDTVYDISGNGNHGVING